MTENEVNEKVKSWLVQQGYKYKGILNTKPKENANPSGYGQIPVPDGLREDGSPAVLIDHQGHKDCPADLLWVEAKGGGVGMSMLLEGFSRMAYGVYHGGGRGLLAVPSAEFNTLLTQRPFLRAVGVASERSLGLLDAETGAVAWFC